MNGVSGLVRQYLLLQVLLLGHLQGKVLSELVDATKRRLHYMINRPTPVINPFKYSEQAYYNFDE